MTQDDFRFVRVWIEVPLFGQSSRKWAVLNKGGAYSKYYLDTALSLNWVDAGRELKAYHLGRFGTSSKYIFSEQYYGRAAITYTQRSQVGFGARAMPAGLVFTHKGPAIISQSMDKNLAMLALCNSEPFRILISMQMAFGSYEVGVIQRTPVPDLNEFECIALAKLARRAWSLKRRLDTAELISHAFLLPALLRVSGLDLAGRVAAWSDQVYETEQGLAAIQANIDERCFDLYGLDSAERSSALGTGTPTEVGMDTEGGDSPDKDNATHMDAKDLAAELFDWLVGVAFGRYDVRLATGEREPRSEPEPFDPLPVCSPGMLTGDDGLPLPALPPGYPLDIPTDGVLVDDAGSDGSGPAKTDLLHRVQQVLYVIWGEDAAHIEPKLCQLLDVRSLRDWLQRPSAYFADHLGRYSKSRRKAPICWPLSTESGSWTLWLYYPRLTDQTLYSCVNEHIDPKLREIERDLVRLRAGGQSEPKAQKRMDTLVELQRELKSMREELLRIAKRPYKPNQNDGVLITASPLWRLFRHKPWRKNLQKCWDELEAGKYDWSHLAYAIWPDRVREACKKDKSIAIAHGLEELFDKQD